MFRNLVEPWKESPIRSRPGRRFQENELSRRGLIRMRPIFAERGFADAVFAADVGRSAAALRLAQRPQGLRHNLWQAAPPTDFKPEHHGFSQSRR